MSARIAYEYVVLRCVPRVEREEFLNIGVVLHSQEADFLSCAQHVDEARLRAVDPAVDVASVRAALGAIEAVCSGDEHATVALGSRRTLVGDVAHADTLGSRFGFVKSPRSTVVQPGPVHGGLTDDPRAELLRLLEKLVAQPASTDQAGQTGTSSTAPTA